VLYYQGQKDFSHRLSNLLSNTNKRDLIAAFHGSGTGSNVIRAFAHPPPTPITLKYFLHKAVMDTGSRLKLVRESYKLSQRELASVAA
jgi:hypothetical protein